MMDQTEEDIKCACNHLTSFTVVQVRMYIYALPPFILSVCVHLHVVCYVLRNSDCISCCPSRVQVQSQEEANGGVQAQVEDVAIIAAPTVVAAVAIIGGAVAVVTVILTMQW